MPGHSSPNQILVVVLLCASFFATAQEVKEPRPMSEEWTRSYQPFRIAGNLYYVGTYDLACYLITTVQGNILINTGMASSSTQIKANIETLGFKFSDIKILLTTQAHYDHMGAMADIKTKTGAQLMVNEKEITVLKDGGNSDYAMGGNGSYFKPVTPDRLLHDSDTVQLGTMQLVMLHHPGHTKGSSSFLFTVKDDKRSYRVLVANMPTIVTDKPFAEITSYPEIADDYAFTFRNMKNIQFDIWLASHASQFKLHAKHKPGGEYDPAAFVDRAGYDAAISDLQKQFDKNLQH